jgi:hypothetical protein
MPKERERERRRAFGRDRGPKNKREKRLAVAAAYI